MAESRQYELVYVVAPDVGDEEVAAVHTQVEEIVAAGGGTIDKTDNWGRRRLAYEINRFKEGTYVLELITGSGAVVGELDRRLKVADHILRYLIVRVDEDLRKAERARSQRQTRRQRRRDARGGAPSPAPADPPAAESPATESPAPAPPAAESPAAESPAPVPPGAGSPAAESPAPAPAAAEPPAAESTPKAEVNE